jgi:hypothetical protein
MTDQRQFDPRVPTDAVEIVAALVRQLRMDGLTGAGTEGLWTAIATLRQHVAPKPEQEHA